MIRHFSVLDSTSAEAWRLLAAGEKPGFVVVADRQTAGRGREGRTFHSPEGGLWASITMRSALPPAEFPSYGVAAGVASAEALRGLTGLAVDLRWPNDLMMGRLKLGGILLEARGDLLVVGIGINLSQDSFPDDLKGIATSVKLAGGRVPSRDDLLEAIRLSDPSDLLARWRALCRTLGRKVRVETPGRTLEGRMTGLDLAWIEVEEERLAAGHVTRLREL